MVIDSYTDQSIEGEGTPDRSRESEEQQTSKELGSGAAPTSLGGSLDNPQGDSISSAASSSENSNNSGEGADRSGVEAIASNQMFIGLIIGILGVTVVLLMATILVMYRYDHLKTHFSTFYFFSHLKARAESDESFHIVRKIIGKYTGLADKLSKKDHFRRKLVSFIYWF